MNSLHGNDSYAVRAPEQARLLSLIQLAKGLEERVEEALGEAQLSLAKYGVLNHLVEAGNAIPLSDLASRVNCVRSNVTQMVDRLEAEGLVRRTANPADRRIILAELTDEGRRRQAVGAQRINQLEAQVAAVVSDTEQVTLRRALKALD